MSVSGNQPKGIVLAATNCTNVALASLGAPATYVEMVAATSTPVYITSIACTTATTGTLDIGIGAAGAEVVVISVRVWSGVNDIALSVPVRVTANTRIAAKVSAASSTNSAITYVNESAVV